MEKTISIATSSGEIVKMPLEHALKCNTFKDMIEDVGEIDTPIPVGYGPETIKKVVEFSSKYDGPDVAIPDGTKPLTGWQLEFVDVDDDLRVQMLLVANFLNLQPMLDLMTKKFAEMMIGKTPEEIRVMYGLQNDLTEEDLKQLYSEIQWEDN